MTDYDILIIGAGAAGLMAGAIAGQRGRRVLIVDHAKAPAEKIRISGGGRCNFTNRYCGPDNFLSQNPHYCKSALAGFTPDDFIAMVKCEGIAYHEKQNPSALPLNDAAYLNEGPQADIQLGQLFCDGKSQQIIDMLLGRCKGGGVDIRLNTSVDIPEITVDGYSTQTSRGLINSRSVIVACGGPSIPKMGASRFGYKIAQSFGLSLIEPRPALVPLTITGDDAEALATLSGVSTGARISNALASFQEALLITHRGLSGPAILQISSYWEEGQSITIDLMPNVDIRTRLNSARQSHGRQSPKAFLDVFLPSRLAVYIAEKIGGAQIGSLSKSQIDALIAHVGAWTVRPAGTEGYRKAEVTLGGIDTQHLSSKTMEARGASGLYFIGEVVDVTGHLGGHNFQWAWASGYAAGQVA